MSMKNNLKSNDDKNPVTNSISVDMPPATTEYDSKGQPYTLDSSNLLTDMTRIVDNASSEIEAIVKSQNAIREQLERNITTMTDRANVEILGRQNRIDDLNIVISMVTRGITRTSFPPSDPIITASNPPAQEVEEDNEPPVEVNEEDSTGSNTQILSNNEENEQ